MDADNSSPSPECNVPPDHDRNWTWIACSKQLDAYGRYVFKFWQEYEDGERQKLLPLCGRKDILLFSVLPLIRVEGRWEYDLASPMLELSLAPGETFECFEEVLVTSEGTIRRVVLRHGDRYLSRQNNRVTLSSSRHG